VFPGLPEPADAPGSPASTAAEVVERFIPYRRHQRLADKDFAALRTHMFHCFRPMVKVPALPRGVSVAKPSGTSPKPRGVALRATSRSPLAIPPRASARHILAKARKALTTCLDKAMEGHGDQSVLQKACHVGEKKRRCNFK
jgi:hypothetical protein